MRCKPSNTKSLMSLTPSYFGFHATLQVCCLDIARLLTDSLVIRVARVDHGANMRLQVDGRVYVEARSCTQSGRTSSMLEGHFLGNHDQSGPVMTLTVMNLIWIRRAPHERGLSLECPREPNLKRLPRDLRAEPLQSDNTCPILEQWREHDR